MDTNYDASLHEWLKLILVFFFLHIQTSSRCALHYYNQASVLGHCKNFHPTSFQNESLITAIAYTVLWQESVCTYVDTLWRAGASQTVGSTLRLSGEASHATIHGDSCSTEKACLEIATHFVDSSLTLAANALQVFP